MPISTRSSVLCICLFGLLAWLPGVLDAAFVWDDDFYVTENESLQSLDQLATAIVNPRELPQYYPVTHVSFFIERSLFGENPRAFRATNMLLHVASALLLFFLLRRLSIRAALLAALLFCVHPVMTESVLWITERKNTLSLFFMLLSLRWLLRCDSGPTRADWAGAFLFFIAALLSKSVACATPAVYLLLRHLQQRLHRRDLWRMLPFFIVGLAAAGLTSYLEREHVGALGREWDLSLAERAIIAGRALFFYAGKLLVPWPLSFNYERWQIDATSWQLLWPAAALLVIVSLVVWRQRLGRGPVVALFIFGGLLLPALGFINIYPMRYSFVADHFQYHASPAFLVLLAASLHAVLQRRALLLQRLVSAVLVVALVLLTWSKTPAWSSPEALWQDTLRWNPTSFLAQHHLGDLRRAEGDWTAALEHHRAARDLRPDLGNLWSEVGIDLEQLGQEDLALEHFETAKVRTPEDPKIRLNLARAYLRRGRATDALKELDDLDYEIQALPLSRGLRGAALLARGRFALALADLEVAAADPEATETDHLNLSIATEKLRGAEAALKIVPATGSARIRQRRAHLLVELGRFAEAFEIVESKLAEVPERNVGHLYIYLLATKRDGVSSADIERLRALSFKLEGLPGRSDYAFLGAATLAARRDRFDDAIIYAKFGLAEAEAQGQERRAALYRTLIPLFSRQQCLFHW